MVVVELVVPPLVLEEMAVEVLVVGKLFLLSENSDKQIGASTRINADFPENNL